MSWASTAILAEESIYGHRAQVSCYPARVKDDAEGTIAALDDGVGMLIGGGAMRHRTTGERIYHLGMLDLDAAQPRPASIPLDFLAHGITPCPHEAHHYVLFEKHGPGACVIDVAARRVVKTIAPGHARQFYGHGVFSSDGSLLYCTETHVADHKRGYIAVRDGRSLDLVGEFPSFGVAPHDCMLTEDGRTLVVSNGGSRYGRADDRPSVAWVDVRSQTLLERHEIPDPTINAGHLAMTREGDLAVVSAPREGLDQARRRGGIVVHPRGGELTVVREPAKLLDGMLGETLSVAIHEPTRILGATSPLGDIVAYFRLDDGSLVGSHRVPNPRGIALSRSGRELVINFGTPPRAARVDAETLVPVDVPGNLRGFPSLVTGSHITMVPAPAA